MKEFKWSRDAYMLRCEVCIVPSHIYIYIYIPFSKVKNLELTGG